MKVQIKNIGAVKEATIDLNKKLNVFCGGNSTGKTYMAYLLYSITSLENKSFGLKLEKNFIDELIEKDTLELDLDINQMYSFLKEDRSKIIPNLWKLFAIPENKSEEFFSKTEINFLEEYETFISRIENIRIDDLVKFHSFQFKIIKNQSSKITIELEKNTIKNEELIRYLEIAFLPILYSKMVYYPVMTSTIFPVERNSIFTFSKELSIKNNERYDMIKELSSNNDFNPIELFFKRTNRYPQPIKDCLKVADDLETIKKVNSIYYDFAIEIEKELLDGNVIIGKDGNVEFLSNKTSRKRTLSFHQSSSIVKTLAGLVIYLKHSAQKNDLVIIDEPELNLHPDNQIKLTRILSRLVNKGLNLVISTHSDYILREINNLIMLGNEDDNISNIKQNYNFKDDEFLSKNDIGVHYFHYKNKTQASVNSIEITDFGFEIPSINDEIMKQNELNNELFYTLKFGFQE
jgi:hypothetical protein